MFWNKNGHILGGQFSKILLFFNLRGNSNFQILKVSEWLFRAININWWLPWCWICSQNICFHCRSILRWHLEERSKGSPTVVGSLPPSDYYISLNVDIVFVTNTMSTFNETSQSETVLNSDSANLKLLLVELN